MGVIAEEVVRIKADTGTFKQDVDGASSGVSKLGLVAGAAAIGGVALLAKGFMDGMQSAIAHQKVMAQTEAVIKSTGQSAGVTAPHVDSLADSIEKMSGIDGDAVIAGENMLLTFTNVKNGVGAGNQIFDDATMILADMSTAMGTDMKASSIQLGKALNDPIKGVGALSKVGVTFTQGQKDSIKAMVEHGNTAGAQKVILAELGKEFGGSAKAAGTTFAGQVKILQAYLGDLEEFIAMKVLPILQRLVAWGIANWPKFQSIAAAAIDALVDAWGDLQPAVQKVIAVFTGAIGVIKDVVIWLNQNRDVAMALGIFVGTLTAAFVIWTTAMKIAAIATKAYAVVQALLNITMMGFPVILIVVAIAAVVAGLVLLYQRSETARQIMDAAWAAIKNAVSTAIAIIVPLITNIATVVSTVVSTVSGLISGNWSTIWAVFSAVVNTVIGIVTGYINGVVNVISGVIALVSALISGDWSAAWDALVQIVTGILQVFNAMMMGIPGMILGVFTDALGVITGALGGWAAAALALGTAVVTGITGALGALVTTVTGFVTGAVGAVTAGVAGAASAAVAFGAGIISGVTGAAGTLATVVGGFLSAAATGITGAVAGIIAVARAFGAGIITGVVAGVTALWTTVSGHISDVATGITNAVAGITNVARSFGLAIVTGAVDGVGEFATRVMGVVGKITGEIASFATNIFNGAKHVGDRIVGGVVSGLGNFVSSAMDVVNNLTGAITSYAGNLYNTGRELAFRLADGIISGLGGLAARAAAVLTSALKSAVGTSGLDLLGSGPFQFTIHEVGAPMAEGVVKGFTEGIGALRPAITDQVGGAFGGVKIGAGSGGLGAGPSTVNLNDSALAGAVMALVDEMRSSRSGGAPVTVVATGGASAAVYSARR